MGEHLTDSAQKHHQTPAVNAWCDNDYPLGIEKTNDCQNSATQRELDRLECKQAMLQAGGAYLDNDLNEFEIDDSHYATYPKGCFVINSTSHHDGQDNRCGSNNACYFYNKCAGGACGGVSADGNNSITAGMPVCYRVKISYGAPNTNGGCPAGYEHVTNPDDCQALAGCMNLGVNSCGRPFEA